SRSDYGPFAGVGFESQGSSNFWTQMPAEFETNQGYVGLAQLVLNQVKTLSGAGEALVSPGRVADGLSNTYFYGEMAGKPFVYTGGGVPDTVTPLNWACTTASCPIKAYNYGINNVSAVSTAAGNPGKSPDKNAINLGGGWADLASSILYYSG